MRVATWDEMLTDAAEMPDRSAVTVGVFDGLHRGHRALVSRVVSMAPGLMPVAVTFKDNPKKVTRPHRFSGDLFSVDQKLAALAEAGIELCILIDFSGNFSKLAGSEFVSTLVRFCGVRTFVVGSDFKCGHRLSTDARGLEAIASGLGVSTEIVEPVTFEGDIVSSSRIRSAIENGRTDLALAMLGRPYTLDLRGIGIDSVGSEAMAVIRGRGLVEPAPGIYEATLLGSNVHKDIEATLRLDGTVLWPINGWSGGIEPDFLAFGPKIA